MASFPEVVLRVRFRCQQFNKYMVPTVTKYKYTWNWLAGWQTTYTQKANQTRYAWA